MKKIIILIITASFIVGGIFFVLAKKKENFDIDYTKLGVEIENLESSKQNPEINKEDQINVLRNRFSLRGIIMKGDNYFENNQLMLALNEYLKAYRESPNDDKIIEKIGDVYFELKNFSKAEEFFTLINRKDEIITEKLISSIFYQIDFSQYDQIKESVQRIKDLKLPIEQQFYYMNSLNCSVNFHECKKYFHNYFNKNPEITFSKLNNIKDAFTTFENFQSENIYYKDALMIGAFFRDKMYSLSNFLGEKMLEEKSDYQPILLMVGKGEYELGHLTQAQDFLLKYYKINPEDISIAYLLGNIYFRQRDYTSSNLYYNVALRNNFEPKIELQRKLIYNHYLLNDKRSMLNLFSYLLDEKGAQMEDYSLGIYHAILMGRTANASIWAKRGIENFGDQQGREIFYGYLGWIEREAGNLETAEEYIKNGLNINPRNPLLTLNYGYIEKAKGNYPTAMIYLKRTVNFNGEGEFGELAQKEITVLEARMQQINQGL